VAGFAGGHREQHPPGIEKNDLPADGKHADPLAGGDPRPINGFAAGEAPLAWTADGRALFLTHPGELPASINRLDIATGQRTLLKQLMPLDSAGVQHIGPIRITPDGKTYVYGFQRRLSDLYIVEGLK
jgi:hypothetical protein